MVYSLLTVLLITLAATWWARRLAVARGRHVAGWAFAAAMLPPSVLILWVLPPRPQAATEPMA